jgi:hypothetical protein
MTCDTRMRRSRAVSNRPWSLLAITTMFACRNDFMTNHQQH